MQVDIRSGHKECKLVQRLRDVSAKTAQSNR